MAFHLRLPAGEAPEFTDGYEGFYHLISMQGTAEQSKLAYIIRDFDRASFENRKANISSIVEEFKSTYGDENVLLEMNDQYYNMREKSSRSAISSTSPTKQWKTSASHR